MDIETSCVSVVADSTKGTKSTKHSSDLSRRKKTKQGTHWVSINTSTLLRSLQIKT